MSETLYSVRMRAAQGGPHERGGKHISGAERIAFPYELMDTIHEMVKRAQGHERGCPDFINLNIEMMNMEEIEELTSLPVYTIQSKDKEESQEIAKKLLELAGVKRKVVEKAYQYLLAGPAADGINMRGAILMDIHSGERLEDDWNRGVRVSGMDYAPESRQQLAAELHHYGLNNEHVREALCLATKVASLTGIVGELCWSDDPSYTVGYIASSKFGYLRLEHMKDLGSEQGGRVFFVNSQAVNLLEITKKLEGHPCLIKSLGKVHGTMKLDVFKAHIGAG